MAVQEGFCGLLCWAMIRYKQIHTAGVKLLRYLRSDEVLELLSPRQPCNGESRMRKLLMVGAIGFEPTQHSLYNHLRDSGGI